MGRLGLVSYARWTMHAKEGLLCREGHPRRQIGSLGGLRPTMAFGKPAGRFCRSSEGEGNKRSGATVGGRRIRLQWRAVRMWVKARARRRKIATCTSTSKPQKIRRGYQVLWLWYSNTRAVRALQYKDALHGLQKDALCELCFRSASTKDKTGVRRTGKILVGPRPSKETRNHDARAFTNCELRSR